MLLDVVVLFTLIVLCIVYVSFVISLQLLFCCLRVVLTVFVCMYAGILVVRLAFDCLLAVWWFV